MDIERTKQFYRELKQSDLCGCAYCRNYVKEAAKAYPAVTAYLQTLGVDIAKPFETMPLELDEDGRMPYIGPQYLVFGAEAGFAAATVKDGLFFAPAGCGAVERIADAGGENQTRDKMRK